MFELARVGTYGSRGEVVSELRRYLHAHAASDPQVLVNVR